jgi:hypothetical protein
MWKQTHLALADATPAKWFWKAITHLNFSIWREWQESNLQVAVLETAAVPVEPHSHVKIW